MPQDCQELLERFLAAAHSVAVVLVPAPMSDCRGMSLFRDRTHRQEKGHF
jgi:hypothetical protein